MYVWLKMESSPQMKLLFIFKWTVGTITWLFSESVVPLHLCIKVYNTTTFNLSNNIQLSPEQ